MTSEGLTLSGLLALRGEPLHSALTAEGRAVETGSKRKSPFDMLINQFSQGTGLLALALIENSIIDQKTNPIGSLFA